MMEETVVEDSVIVSTPSTTGMRQIHAVSCQCKICGVPARYSYYGAIVCHSCKMFFKRNSEKGQAVFKCDLDNECEININNRRICQSCRLAKCFANGMQTELIRCPPSKKEKTSSKEKSVPSSIALITTCSMRTEEEHQPDQILTSNLLQPDQSTLSIDQWNLLSHLVHCFEEHSGYSSVKSFIEEQNTLPLKLRFRYAAVRDFFTSMMGKVQLVFEKNRDCLSLSLHDRTTLLRNTVEHTATIGGMFILRQANLLDNLAFFKSAETIFQPAVMVSTKRFIDQLDSDDTFNKLVLAIVAVSSINYTVCKSNTLTNLTNIKAMLPTQNMYIELAWRYLLHKYDHPQAVKHFSNLIRCLLLVLKVVVEAYEVQPFTDIIDSVIEQTRRKLIQ